MIPANFFDRTATAAAHVLTKSDPLWFRERLKKLAVCIAFDDAAASCSEGVATLELATDMLARFYPGIRFLELGETLRTRELAARIKAGAKAIHPRIDLSVSSAKLSCCLVVGESLPALDVPTVFLGSEGWTASLRYAGPSGSQDSGNPFGAAAAACLGVAALFRTVFANELQMTGSGGPVDLDVLHHRTHRSPADVRLPAVIDIGRSHIVGLGAIGRPTCWTLARAGGLRGELHGVDGERIDRSNLQRYVGTTQEDARTGRVKTRSVTRIFAQTGQQGLKFVEHPMRWGDFLRESAEFDLPRVAVALDTAKDRVEVQASLPLRLLNAWTQPGDLGVSRHDFEIGPCLACLYLPPGEAKSLSFLVAENLCLPEPEIRAHLYADYKVDATFLSRVAEATDVPLDALLPFINEPLRSFYSKAVCGTALFRTVRDDPRGESAVPMAFQSVLAGVLLAAELVADSVPLRTLPMPPLTTLNLLAPLGSHLLVPAVKHASGRCLCQDPSYQRAFRSKYSRKVASIEELADVV